MLQAQILRQTLQTINRRPASRTERGSLSTRVQHRQERQIAPEAILGTVCQVFWLEFLTDGRIIQYNVQVAPIFWASIGHLAG